MKSICVKNLRCLKDTGDVELKPITMLVGANSSGKSTFLRTFPLIKQGGALYKQGPILWYGSEVDFGSFEDAVRRGENFIKLSFVWDAIDASPYFVDSTQQIFNVRCEIKVEKKDEDESFISQIIIRFEDNQEVDIHMSEDKTSVIINGIDSTLISDVKIQYRGSRFILPNIEINRGSNDFPIYITIPIEYVNDTLGRIPSFKSKIPKSKRGASFFPSISSSEDMLKETCINYKVAYDEHYLKEDSWKKYQALSILSCLNEFVLSIDRTIQQELGYVYYIKPFRASAERYYRQQNLAVRNLESDGHNMAMFVANMYKNKSMKNDFQQWTRDYFGFIVEPRRIEGHMSLAIKDKLSSINEDMGIEYRNITDKGFGYSQILPIILTLWQISSKQATKREKKYTCFAAYEQPELHLHPKMQAELMDAIIATTKAARERGVDVKFLIETHSPVMINRLGLRIAIDPDLKANMTSVLLFDENDANSPKVASFTEDGRLTNWPYGFFEPDLN